MQGESSDDQTVSEEEEMVRMMIGTINGLNAEIDERFVRLKILHKFDFLLGIKSI